MPGSCRHPDRTAIGPVPPADHGQPQGSAGEHGDDVVPGAGLQPRLPCECDAPAQLVHLQEPQVAAGREHETKHGLARIEDPLLPLRVGRHQHRVFVEPGAGRRQQQAGGTVDLQNGCKAMTERSRWAAAPVAARAFPNQVGRIHSSPCSPPRRKSPSSVKPRAAAPADSGGKRSSMPAAPIGASAAGCPLPCPPSTRRNSCTSASGRTPGAAIGAANGSHSPPPTPRVEGPGRDGPSPPG